MAAAQLKRTFREADKEGTGNVSSETLREALKTFLPSFSEIDVDRILGHFGSEVPYDSFIDSLFGTQPVQGRLAGKVAIVTGAGSAGPGWGIGKAIAVAMARQGAAVGLVDMNTAAAEETAKIIRDEGNICCVLPKCDISKVDEVNAMVTACESELGPVTTLVNNVGLVCPGDVTSVPLDKWEFINNINLMGAYNCTRACVSSFVKSGKKCSIVNVSSISSLRAIRSEVAYAASKGGMNSLSLSVGRELAGRNVRVNTVAPGLVETPLVWNAYKDKSPEELKEIMAARHSQSPTGTMGDAWDIAHACVYFGSDESSYANGVLMAVDGGFTQQVLAHEAGMPLLMPPAEKAEEASSKRLGGKVAIITGTAFCEAIASTFIQHGASVLLACDDAEAICTRLASESCSACPCDLTLPESVEEMVKKAVQAYGGLDLLVNGPGIEGGKGIEDTTSEAFASIYKRNATGVLHTLRFALPPMQARGGGAIVNMSSMAGQRYLKPDCAVAAAAGSLNVITTQTATEFAPQGIRCNCLVPFVLGESASKGGYEYEVANAALYLCSNESRYISGQIINLDMSQACRVAVKM